MRATLLAPALLAAVAAAILAPSARAQDATTPAQPPVSPDTELYRDTITVGGGVASVPSYEGSDSNRWIPAAAARGSIDGYAFSTRGARLFVDIVRNQPGPVVDVQFGPVIGVNLNRTSRRAIDDARVEALGTVDTAIELGGYVGIGKTGVLTSPYDKVSASVSYVHDVANAHDSYVITPQIDYGTPLSRKAYVGVSANATYVGNGYARTYFGIDAAGAARSTLPAFSADKGWKNWSLSALGTVALTGDLLGGLSLVGGVSYARLLGDFARSPVTRIAGDRDQWFGAVGLAYTF